MGHFLVCLGAVAALACGAAETRPVVAKRPLTIAKAGANDSAARNHQRAQALLNEGDALVRVSVDEAIEKYRQALRLEPNNLDGLWKVSLAHEKKADWAAVAAMMERAVSVAPNAEYLHLWGRALVESAQASGGGALMELAREPLERCLKTDPKSADCAFLLGEVEWSADHVPIAAKLFTLALRLDPQQARYYESLVWLYSVFKQPEAAEMVLTEGLRQVPVTERNRGQVAAMALLAARLAGARNDALARQAWLDRAESLADDASPELLFELAFGYAEAVLDGTGPRDTEKALRLLNLSVKRICDGALAARYDLRCRDTESFIQRLRVLDTVAPPVASQATAAVAPTALPSGMPVPKLELQPLRAGDAYTVFGASYFLRYRAREVTGKPVAITGYIVKTNFDEAPRCAVHRAGVADPENCHAGIPAFWLGDQPDAAEADCIKVMGFASNYAQLFEAIRLADSQKSNVPYQDAFWGKTIPNPLPAAGAKVTVRGDYGRSFAKVSSGAETNLTMGVLDFIARDLLEPAPELATLPGVKRRK